MGPGPDAGVGVGVGVGIGGGEGGGVAGATTVIVAVPDCIEFCVDRAVTVTIPEVEGAVSTPDDVIVPTVVDHATAFEKPPVPVTVAEQFVIAPVSMEVGLQTTLTPVIVGGGGGGVPGAVIVTVTMPD